MKPGNTMIGRWMVRMLCAIALVFVGFGHQVPAFANGGFIPAEFAEYVLPDGTLPTLCIADKVDGSHHHDKAHMQGCEACRISASILIPAPTDQAGRALRFEVAVLPPVNVESFYRQLFPPNTGPRAPPSFSVIA